MVELPVSPHPLSGSSGNASAQKVVLQGATPDAHKNLFVGCGMYAFTTDLQKLWSEFFDQLKHASLKEHVLGSLFQGLKTRFSTDEDTYTSKHGLMSQTCGFPYMQQWRDSHSPICVPVFNIEGCHNQNYRSWFVKHRTSHRNSLEDFRGSRVAINGWKSNSGMNVLRFAVSTLAEDGQFFSGVNVTGSHYKSMFAVAKGNAEMAAIDAISFHFACEAFPELVDQLEIFDQSAVTVGLPFIQRRESMISSEDIIRALNIAVRNHQQQTPNKLRLSHFLSVTEADYLPMLDMEKIAAKAGYRTLR